MLVASIVRLTLGLKDHRVVSTEMVSNELHFHLDAKRNRKLRCSVCDERRRPKDKLAERVWRHVSLWGLEVFLHYRPRRVNCPEHGGHVERMPWSMGKKPISFPLITVLGAGGAALRGLVEHGPFGG